MRDAREAQDTVDTGSNFSAPMASSALVAWLQRSEGLIVGLDGELYEAYRPDTIESVQETLRDRGLYLGPVNGILDMPTMRALYTFQSASYGLQRSGIPTPRTRRLLEQGSHTF